MVAVAVAALPIKLCGALIATVGADVYPSPELVITMLSMLKPRVTVVVGCIGVAVSPAPGITLTCGVLVYLSPPFVTTICDTLVLYKLTFAVAAPPTETVGMLV